MSFKTLKLISALVFLTFKRGVATEDSSGTVPSFSSIAETLGYDCVAHRITTKDGYILTLFNIPGNKTRPIFFMHGFGDSSRTFIVRGNTSMLVSVVKAGYDVWAGNMRGNEYSRDHVTLNADIDVAAYWNFSYHEVGVYDLPAQIDYILNKTQQNRLSVISHSQGSAVFFVLLSTYPEYNEKIRPLITLGPLSYAQNIRPPVRLLILIAPVLEVIFKALNQYELFDRTTRLFVELLCSLRPFGGELCEAILLSTAGQSDDTFKGGFIRTVINYYPVSTSVKNSLHVAQNSNSRRFAQYDYGSATNIARYGNTLPPAYDLDKVNCSVAILMANNDKLSPIEDNVMLNNSLPNVVVYEFVERSPMNHYDFVWGEDMYLILHPVILKLLERYQ
ncbi:lipase 1-like [Bombyx mandarina]|uniref:Lipase n=1 Tax=Bombyx mandarina TaxID=7092 RepID=A0A6J2JX06_BOMMA|nr:lipase 1-like [Bombyx mandarina]